LAEELRERYKTQSEVIVGDLSQPTTPTRLFEHLRNNGSKVDVLVNNAGFGAYGQFAELDERRQLDMAR
jgi:short-subunit dehydrogenase